MAYSFKREKKETNYLRPRYTNDMGYAFKGLINVSDDPGHICWGIVDDEDKFVMENQQLSYDPWTGEPFPETVTELKEFIAEQ